MLQPLQETYDECIAKGMILQVKFLPRERINTLLGTVKIDLQSIAILRNTKVKPYSTIYKLSYDCIHNLTEAIISLERIKILNHKCLFAYLCAKHPEFEFDWNFLGKVRTKRNGISYYGTPITEKDWKEVALQSELYITKLKEELEKRI